MVDGASYRHFDVAIYARVYEVLQMADLEWLKARFDVMSRTIKVDKVYLEIHRDMVVAPEETVAGAKAFFASRGVKTSGGITITVDESNRFETYCYTNPEHRRKLREVVEYTARLFDELILDDFFFTNCKCPSCIAAKGDRSWTEFRLQLLTEAARDLIIGPAKAANPNVTVIVKYPNWYEHFQGLGFNLETEPAMFDKLYTGTETRDPMRGHQHIQPYEGYEIIRYFENLKPGCNAGGWVDTGGLRDLDRYAEQLWLTLLAKAPEITLFDFRQLQRTIGPSQRAVWQGLGGSFDFDAMIAPVRRENGTWPPETTISIAAGYALEQIDGVLGELGAPLGLKSYRPFHATGEDFLQNYLGMVGVPMDIVPEFPAEAPMMLLTESAKFDTGIVAKIEAQLLAGKDVTITSGLLRALQGRGIEDIVELEYTNRKALVRDFVVGRHWDRVEHADRGILMPQIQYLTNDSWELITCLTEYSGCPLFHQAGYGRGNLNVLTIPDNFSDLYHLPEGVLAGIRALLLEDLYAWVDAPARVATFLYDNDTLVVESFRDEPATVRVVADEGYSEVVDITTGQVFLGRDWPGPGRRPSHRKGFDLTINPHAYRVLRCR
jgi:hypothetical protein